MPALFPVARYGGAERAAYYLAKGLAELGHRNTFLCKPGSRMDFADTLPLDEAKDLASQIPSGVDVVQLYSTPATLPKFPYLVCIQGNGKPGEKFLPNTVFLSQDHAQRHNWTEFVFNGIDPDEYPLSIKKNADELLFLAKGSWPVKNLFGALKLAKEADCSLNVLGAEASVLDRICNRHAHFFGMIGGEEKLRVLQQSQTLLFPVLWNEPFGVALIEALATGCSVVGSDWGSIPEIVDDSCGKTCSTKEGFLQAIAGRSGWSPEACRRRVVDHFTHRHQAEKYLSYYQKVNSGHVLREGHPFCSSDFIQEEIRSIGGLPLSLRARIKKKKQLDSVL